MSDLGIRVIKYIWKKNEQMRRSANDRQLLNLSGESMSLDTLNEDVVNYDFLNVLLLQKGSK